MTVPIDEVIKVVEAMYHEEAHLLQFQEKFREDSPEAIRMAIKALAGRLMPGHGAAIYWDALCELDAELYAFRKTSELFEAVFPEDGTALPEGELPVDTLLAANINRRRRWHVPLPVASFDQAMAALADAIRRGDAGLPPVRRNAAAGRTGRAIGPLMGLLFGAGFDLSAGPASDPETAAYDKARDRAAQHRALLDYARRHPAMDIDLFPNLAGEFEGIDRSGLKPLQRRLAVAGHMRSEGRQAFSFIRSDRLPEVDRGVVEKDFIMAAADAAGLRKAELSLRIAELRGGIDKDRDRLALTAMRRKYAEEDPEYIPWVVLEGVGPDRSRRGAGGQMEVLIPDPESADGYGMLHVDAGRIRKGRGGGKSVFVGLGDDPVHGYSIRRPDGTYAEKACIGDHIWKLSRDGAAKREGA